MPTHQIIQTKVGDRLVSGLSLPNRDTAITSRSSNTETTCATNALIRDVSVAPGRESRLKRG